VTSDAEETAADAVTDRWDDEWDEDWDDDTDEGDSTEPTTTPVELSATLAAEDAGAEHLAIHGEIEILGRMPWSSNGTFLVTVTDGEDHANAIYKPERFERPLWDYPTGLWRREISTFELSRALGWDLIPPTVRRDDDAPLGVGSLQFFVPAQFSEHYFTLRDRPEHLDALRRMCALDLIANNCDRKAGHVLVSEDGRIWGIDHGLSFHAEFKLRTVIWDFAGEPIGDDIAEAICGLLDTGLPDAMVELLDPFERAATLDRARAVLSNGAFPSDPTGRRVPWPMV
jgi:uncharacterized repeat protein (TIGR03843 family)